MKRWFNTLPQGVTTNRLRTTALRSLKPLPKVQYEIFFQAIMGEAGPSRLRDPLGLRAKSLSLSVTVIY